MSTAVLAFALAAVACTDTTDPTAPLDSPIRRLLRKRRMQGVYEGAQVRMVLPQWMQGFWEPKIKLFEAMTGADVAPTYSPASTWFSDVELDLTETALHHGYGVFGNWIPSFAHVLEDITQKVREQAGLDWFDILPAVRKGVAAYENRIYTIPLDGDVIAMLYRTDIAAAAGFDASWTPRSWDDALTLARYAHGRDLDGDGTPDYGVCLSTARNDISGTLFWSVVAPYMQSRGPSQGLHFNPDTMEPRFHEAGFAEGLRVYRELVKHASYAEEGPTSWGDQLQHFKDGRCAVWFNFLGPLRQAISVQREMNLTNTLRLVELPGARCSALQDCPLAVNDGVPLVNRAPLLAGGGFTIVARESAAPIEKELVYVFQLFLSDPATSYFDVANPCSFLDPLRLRHVATLGDATSPEAKAFLAQGWETQQLLDLRATTEANFLGSNYAMDLRLTGYQHYVDIRLVPLVLQHLDGDLTQAVLIERLTAAWNELTKKYGLDHQRDLYRHVLDLPPYQAEAADSTAITIILPTVGGTAVLIILGLIAYVRYQKALLRRRTRDISRAPVGSEPVCIMFTDIQDSTQLWDADRGAMHAALALHHHCVREVISKHGGYEVKTIGDSFMIAHTDSHEMLRIACGIQHTLLQQTWPTGTLQHGSAGVVRNDAGELVWNGPRVRCGLAFGALNVQYDHVAKGMDYYGDVVNCASRVEHCGDGGQIICTQDVLTKLTEGVTPGGVLESCSAEWVGEALGEIKLRGIRGVQRLFQINPKSLAGRTFSGHKLLTETYHRVNASVPSNGAASEPSELMTALASTLSDTPPSRGGHSTSVYDMSLADLRNEVRRLRSLSNASAHQLSDTNTFNPSTLVTDDYMQLQSVSEDQQSPPVRPSPHKNPLAVQHPSS